jgi:hypothetical protein
MPVMQVGSARTRGGCTDCVNLTKASYRIVRGDNFGGSVTNLVPTVRDGDIAPEGRDSNFGVRCSRAPPLPPAVLRAVR